MPCSGNLGYAKHQSGFALCGILLHHIFAALQNLRFRLFGQQKRRQPRTLYAILLKYFVKILENYRQNIDRDVPFLYEYFTGL
jgi:hypothetical protein